MHFGTILFSMIFVLNGLSILDGARLRIDSRSGCSSYTKIHDRKFCDGMRSMGDRDDNGGLFSSAQKCFEYITNPNSKKAKECDGAYFGWNSRDFWTCRCSTSGCSTLVNSGSDTYETDCKKVPTTTTTEAPTTPAAENTGDCKDKNELCQMEPTFLLDILCQIDTVKEQCPKRCNSCPEPVETTEAPTTTTTAMPKCERKYNGYYSYGDCGSQNGVKSFEECCELTKQRNATSSRNIIRFSWNGNSCAFKCGGKQDNRGGSWWSSAEDISTCTCK